MFVPDWPTFSLGLITFLCKCPNKCFFFRMSEFRVVCHYLFFEQCREREREMHGPKKRGPKPKNLATKVVLFDSCLMPIHDTDSLGYYFDEAHWLKSIFPIKR